MKKEDKKSPPENPYIAGRREWNERYGSYVEQAATWKLVAFITLVLMALSIAGIAYIGSQSKIIPYVVEVDKLGQPLTVGKLSGKNFDEEKIVMYSLASTITNLRTIWSDPKMQKEMIFDAYKYIKSGSTAERKINEEFEKQNPFMVIGKLQRSVQITNVLRETDNTWAVEWEEKTTELSGRGNETATYKALIQLEIIPPSSVKEIYKNPLGIKITEYTYTKNNK